MYLTLYSIPSHHVTCFAFTPCKSLLYLVTDSAKTFQGLLSRCTHRLRLLNPVNPLIRSLIAGFEDTRVATADRAPKLWSFDMTHAQSSVSAPFALHRFPVRMVALNNTDKAGNSLSIVI